MSRSVALTIRTSRLQTSPPQACSFRNLTSRLKSFRTTLPRMTATTDKGRDDGVSGAGPMVIEEGKAKISFADKVFYNPVQEFNRDLSIAVIQRYVDKLWPGRSRPGDVDIGGDVDKGPEKVKILEALSATGLRSIRYAKEIGGDGVGKVVANDWSKAAVESIRRNVVDNGVEHLVEPSLSDATMIMYQNRKKGDRFGVVDLDPYGSPTPFLDGAVQAVSEGGLLCVTCTDLAVLAGNSPETCYAKYGAVSLKSKSCHEMALRIVLQCIEAHANRYGRYIVPLLSVSVDFYVRVFVTVHTSQAKCKRTTSKLGYVYRCNGCESQWVQPLGLLALPDDGSNNVKFKLPTGPPVDSLCKYCGHPFTMGGPFWLAPIHDPNFVQGLCESLTEENVAASGVRFNTMERMVGMLTVIGEELHDVPFYYNQDRLCSILKCHTGKLTMIRSALLNAGYRVSLSHASKLALKTDAPNDFVWRVLREWRRGKGGPDPDPEKGPVDVLAGLQPNSVAHRIMSLDESRLLPVGVDGEDERAKSAVNFAEHPDANPESRKIKMRRFQVNPPNWGPRMRATTVSKDGLQIDKRAQNQGKGKKKNLAGSQQDGRGPQKRPRSDPAAKPSTDLDSEVGKAQD